MNYWMTTHWPYRVDTDPSEPPAGVSVQSHHGRAITDLDIGDLVWIYESKTGKTVVYNLPEGGTKEIPCRPGRQGMIGLVAVTSTAYEPEDSEELDYSDGSKYWWRWHFDTTPVNTAGFIPRAEVAEILGYSTGYNFRGFGVMRSGLRQITQDEHESLLRRFIESQADEDQQRLQAGESSAHQGGRSGSGGGEGDEHRALKTRIASNPPSILNEEGLTLVRVEFPFATEDRADVVLRDRYGRFVVVEVEGDCGADEVVGPMQCMKYRSLLAYQMNRREHEVRAILAATGIHTRVRRSCREYKIETVEILYE